MSDINNLTDIDNKKRPEVSKSVQKSVKASIKQSVKASRGKYSI